MTAKQTPPLEAVALDGQAAAQLSGLSSKTLERRSFEGEQLGRMKIGRRVLYHRETLVAWLASKANPLTVPPSD